MEAHQTPNALRKLLEDLGDDSPLPAPPQFGRYDSSEGRNGSGIGSASRSMIGRGSNVEPESPVMGKGRGSVERSAEVGNLGREGAYGSPMVRSVSVGTTQAGPTVDEYDSTFARKMTTSDRDRSLTSSSNHTYTPPPSGTSIRSNPSQTSSAASYRSTSGLTNTSAISSNSVTLTPPYDDANDQYPHVDPGSGDSAVGTSRSSMLSSGPIGGRRIYGPAARLHSGQAHRPFGRTVSQPHATKSASMGTESGYADNEEHEREKYMLGRSFGGGSARPGIGGGGNAAIDLVAVLGRKGRESGESTMGHEGEAERTRGVESEGSTLANSSSTTLVPARPSAIRSSSNTSSRGGGTDSPSVALTASTSNAYTPANTGRTLASSTTSASRSRPTVPSRFGLPVRRRPDMLMEAQYEADQIENMQHGRPEAEQMDDAEPKQRSSPPAGKWASTSSEHWVSPIRAEPSLAPPRRHSPPMRQQSSNIPPTIEEDQMAQSDEAYRAKDLMQRPIQPQAIRRPRAVSHSPVYENGTATTAVSYESHKTARSGEGYRRSPSHPHLGVETRADGGMDMMARREAPPRPSSAQDPYAAYDLVRRKMTTTQQGQEVENPPTRLELAADRTSPPLQVQLQPDYHSVEQGQYGSYADQIVRTTTPAPPTGKKIFTVNKLEYERLYKLGKGGSGTVYAVLHPVKRIAVALKRVAFNGCDADTIANYKNEVDLLARLSGHDRIIKLLDFEITVGGNGKAKSLTVIMEAGEASFDALLDEQSHKPLNLSWVATYWEQMLEGVQAVHEQRVVHTDLKPANFVLVKGKLKIIDFGIAKAIANDTVNIQRDQQIGSINYMSPEAINKMNTGNLYKLSFPSDVWSMGCILYQMIYGKCPFSQIQGGAFAKFAYIGGGQFTIRYKKRYNSEVGAFAKDELDEPADSIVTKAAIDAMEACLRFDQHDRKTIPSLMNCSFLHPERDLTATVITRANMAQLVAATYNVRDLIEHGGSHDISDARGRVIGTETVLGANPKERLATYATGLMEQLQMVNGQIAALGN